MQLNLNAANISGFPMNEVEKMNKLIDLFNAHCHIRQV